MRPVTVEVVTSDEPMTQEALERWARNYVAAVVGLDRENEAHATTPRSDDTITA
jgi:hypothetical protein